MKPETILQRKVQDALEAMGIWVIPMAVAGKRSKRSVRTGEPGMPDLCLPALGWIECKVGKGKRSPEQEAWHERAKKEGVWVATVWSLEEAIRVVAERRMIKNSVYLANLSVDR